MLTPSDQPVSSRLNISELDGDPSLWPWKLWVSNGSLTDNGDGTVTLIVGSGSGGGIPQLDIDPVAPTAESAWVLKSGGGGIGTGGTIRAIMGLGFPYLTRGVGISYFFSYRTKEGNTKRVALT